MIKLLFILSILFIACSTPAQSETKECSAYSSTIFCDFENIESNAFITKDGYSLQNIKTSTTDHFFSGSKAVKVDKNQKYGATLKLPVQPGDLIHVSIKRLKNKSNSPLIISIKEGKYHSVNKGIPFNENWELLEKKVTVLSSLDNSIATIFTSYSSTDSMPGYFDDLQIKILRRDDTIYHPEFPNPIKISIPQQSLNDIKHARRKAFKAGIINDSLKEWKSISLVCNGKSFKGKLRIKGDWTEHLETDKWGVKIKLKKPLFGSEKFSLVKPYSRSGIREYLYHKVLEHENILTTKYTFIGLSINQLNKGLFGIEEHFDDLFLTNRNLPAGPILKIGEAELWKGREKNFYKNMYLEEGKVKYFEIGKLKNYSNCSDSLAQKGKLLLNNFRRGEIKTSKAFDIEYLAKFFAITNVMSAHHSLIWHNSRFYYNPKTNKLYPIAYDGYSHGNYLIRDGFIGDSSEEISSHWFSLFLNDEIFMKAYKKELITYSQDEFLKSMLNKFESDIQDKISKIKIEQCDYNENFDYLYKNSRTIRKRLEL